MASSPNSEEDSDDTDLATRIMHTSLTSFLSNLTLSYTALCTSLPRSLTSFSSPLDLFKLSCATLLQRAHLFPLQLDNLHSLCDYPTTSPTVNGCGQAAEWAVGKYWGDTASACLVSEYAERYMVQPERLREAVKRIKVTVLAVKITEAVPGAAKRPQVEEEDEVEVVQEDEGMSGFAINAPPV